MMTEALVLFFLVAVESFYIQLKIKILTFWEHIFYGFPNVSNALTFQPVLAN